MSSEQRSMRLLENLTPGGSEFFENPKRCAEWVERRLSEAHRITVKAILDRNETQAELAAARAQAAEVERKRDALARENERLRAHLVDMHNCQTWELAAAAGAPAEPTGINLKCDFCDEWILEGQAISEAQRGLAHDACISEHHDAIWNGE